MPQEWGLVKSPPCPPDPVRGGGGGGGRGLILLGALVIIQIGEIANG